jgi:hypothetical protein
LPRPLPASSCRLRCAAASVLGALAALAVAGCTVPATQLLVSIDTDFFVPGELDTIRVRVLYASEAEGAPDEERDFAVPPALDPGATEAVIGGLRHEVRRTLDIPLGPAGILPYELSLVPAAGDERRVARIEAYGLRDGVVRAAGSVRTRFVRHRTTRVSLFVFVACDQIECPPDATCGAGGACVPNQVEPTCLEDPRLCPDAPPPPRDAGPSDAGPGDAPGVCGDGVWDPRTEECDGTDDCCDRSDLSECGVPCRLLVPPPDPCASPELLTGPLPLTVEGRFAGASSRRRSPCSSTFASGREVVYAIDADLEFPLRFELLTDGMTLTVSPECPALMSGLATLRGACAGPRRTSSSTPPMTFGQGPVDVYFYNGRVYIMIDEAAPSDYEREFSFRVSEAPLDGLGAGTCADPYAVAGSVLFGLSGGTPDTFTAVGGGCAGAAGGDLWFAVPDPFAERRQMLIDSGEGNLRTEFAWTVCSSGDEVVAALVEGCGPATPRSCVAATRATGTALRGGLLFYSPVASRRWVVDGVLAETQWIGFSLDAQF